MFALVVIATLSFTANAASFTSQIDVSNVTNDMVSKYIYGMNIYQDYGLNNLYTGNYTLGRLGGNSQTRFNYTINAANSANDYYYISQSTDFTWQQFYDTAKQSGLAFWTQVPAMGWVTGSNVKQWSFSQQKYGQQKSDECTNQPDGTTWCAKDAGNGVWVNGSNVVGNNPYDASIRATVDGAKGFVNAVISAYGNDLAVIFSVDNEPTLWSGTHRDVHPAGSTYDEISNDTLTYGAAIKAACNNNCLVAGYSPWGWCGYFEDGYDHDAGFCTGGGPDYKEKGMPLSAYYLQQAANYEKQNNQRVLDIMDIHYYPAASGVSMSCDESNQQYISNRLQSPRSLYDTSYTDPSWINTQVALIPRYNAWINDYYPGTKLSISEYNFGGDDCITSTIAHSEALAVFATFGVEAATRWSKPKPGAMVTNAWNIFTNYDGKGSNIYDSMPYAVNVKDSNLEIVTSYSFIAKDKSKMFVVFYNKDQNNQNTVTASLINNNDNLTIQGNINVYGVDKSGLSYIGTVTPSNGQFSINMAAWSIRLAVVTL